MAARKAPQDRQPSVREQLRRKRAYSTTFRVHDGDDTDKKRKELEDATSAARMAKLGLLKVADDEKTRLQRQADKLEADFDAECIMLRFRGLAPIEWDALQNEFGEPELSDEEKAALEEKGEKPPTFDRDRYTAALLAASAVDSDVSVDEWFEHLTSGRWSVQEIDGMRRAAVGATHGDPAGGIPKD